MSKRKLPKGEETIPIVEIEGRFHTPQDLRKQPYLLRQVLGARVLTVSEKLLIERVRERSRQGRERTVYRFDRENPELSPEDQIWHMERRTTIGKELLEAEQKLLEEELAILKETAGM